MKFAYILLATLSLGGCFVASATYTPSTTARFPSKPADCDFAVLTTLPEGSLEELGILDIQKAGLVTTAGDFKTIVGPQVCAAGGDIVVAEVNGSGNYVRGSVFRKKGDGAPTKAPAPASGATM